jgi:hypothetical protein
MDNRELERALFDVKDKLDKLDAKLYQIEIRMRKLEDDAIELRGGIKLAKHLV